LAVLASTLLYFRRTICVSLALCRADHVTHHHHLQHLLHHLLLLHHHHHHRQSSPTIITNHHHQPLLLLLPPPQVFKATVSGRNIGPVALTVAIKTLKKHDANARVQLLNEAALMVGAIVCLQTGGCLASALMRGLSMNPVSVLVGFYKSPPHHRTTHTHTHTHTHTRRHAPCSHTSAGAV
jgi:hypothetical protein